MTHHAMADPLALHTEPLCENRLHKRQSLWFISVTGLPRPHHLRKDNCMLADLIKLVSSFAGDYEKGKAQLFNSHVEPLKTQIHHIHKDYVNTFLEVKNALEKKEIPLNDTLVFLEQRRHDLAAERDLLKCLTAELKTTNRRIVAPRTWNAFKDYNESIAAYFVTANSIARASWYSDFIRFMKIDQGFGRTTLDCNAAFGNDPRKDTIEHVTLLLDRKLPVAMNEINRHYATLRSSLL